MHVRAAIAAHLAEADIPETLGEIGLHPHQRVAAERVVALLEQHRGALLADDVGLGKTFVALAVARREPDALVLAPSVLRHVWSDAARRAGVVVRFGSIESLARGTPCELAPFVIVDEAHHLRSRNTKRYARVRELCARARVLLLSATPVQNSTRDLRNILALFLGERALSAPVTELADVIVRRLAGDVQQSARLALPTVDEPRWIQPPEDVDCLDRLLGLPPPVAPSDGGDGGVLLTYSLVRQWASSRAALRAALTRRLARAGALDDALATGRWPSRQELAAWQFADGAQQLTFPELVVHSSTENSGALRDQVRLHAGGVRELLAWLDASGDPDIARADLLHEVAQRHAGESVVVFSEYAETVGVMFRALLHRSRVAMLTHAGGRVAGGHVHREQLLAQFDGRGPRSAESDRVDILVSTDVLSEGVDLHGASVLVHLDLSWNPARIEQRVGRLRRIGAARERVAVYAFAPPAPTERLLRLQQRLRVKLGEAANAIGLAGAIIPGFVAADAPAPVVQGERIERLVRSWRRGIAPEEAMVAAVRSPRDAALACVRHDGRALLLAIDGQRVSDSAGDIEALLVLAGGDDAPVDGDRLETVLAVVGSWLARRATANVIDLPSAHVARSRHHVLRRAQAIAQRAHRHERVALRKMLGAARTVATATLSAGAERVLDELAQAEMPDIAWLQSLGQFAAIHAPPRGDDPDQVLAIILMSSND